MIEVRPTFIFQILNTIALIGLFYLIYFYIVKLPRKVRNNEEKIETLTSALEEIKKEIKNQIK